MYLIVFNSCTHGRVLWDLHDNSQCYQIVNTFALNAALKYSSSNP